MATLPGWTVHIEVWGSAHRLELQRWQKDGEQLQLDARCNCQGAQRWLGRCHPTSKGVGCILPAVNAQTLNWPELGIKVNSPGSAYCQATNVQGKNKGSCLQPGSIKT